MRTLSIRSEAEDQLERRMRALGLRASDLEEVFVRSGGHGGQNVNKTATCVMLRHRPSGIQVKCQATRQQGLNRFIARQRLVEKLEARQAARVDGERARAAKLRRQSRTRSRRARERILQDKARVAAKKALRRRVETD